MSAQVSCPVFRCAKTSVSKCTGFRRKCERYYCQTHTRGTLCDGCAFLKQEDTKAKYRDMLRSLIRKSFSVARTPGVVALFLISVLLLVLVAVRALWESSNASGLTIIMLLGGIVGMFISLFWYFAKAREYRRAESVELDLTNPGFYDYCQQWEAKMDEIGSGSSY